jgi:hypothetical protein
MANLELLMAFVSYNEYYYSNSSFLCRNKSSGELYIVEASHCSCTGFEGQWCGTLTSLAALHAALKEDNSYHPLFSNMKSYHDYNNDNYHEILCKWIRGLCIHCGIHFDKNEDLLSHLNTHTEKNNQTYQN